MSNGRARKLKKNPPRMCITGACEKLFRLLFFGYVKACKASGFLIETNLRLIKRTAAGPVDYLREC
jgi:hypothetical protein